MKNPTTACLCVLTLALAVASPRADAQDFSSQAVATATACSPADGETDGGQQQTLASASAAASGDCGSTGVAQASSSASSNLATGIVSATAQGSGPAGSHRATASSDFRDRLTIVAPADVNSVAIRATVTFTVEGDNTFPFSENRLIANIGVAPNEIDLFLCNPALCPDDPLESLFVSEVFVAQRGLLNGEFSAIQVMALARADMADGAATLTAAVTVSVEDDSGAILVANSGVFGGGATDTDGDSIPDTLDNCSEVANADQRDTNADGFGNLCDPDLNNDLVVNVVDLGMLRDVFFTADPDGDFDGDGVVNFLDLGVLRTYFFGAPGPGATTP